MSLPKDILPQVTAAELDAFSTIGGEERLIAFVNRFRELERERIIKLLESDEWHHIAFAIRSPDEQPTKYHDGECLGCRQIALIKGEQK